VFSPIDPTRMYVCSQHVWLTKNEGQSWDKISPDLTYADPATLGESGGVITHDMSGPELYGTVYALAPSYHDVNTIWAGSDDGMISITRDNGKTWQNITPKDVPKNSRVSIIDASRHKAGTAYVAIKRYQMDDRSPYIYKTDDYGKTWKKIINGIPADDFVHVVREDLVRPGLLFAGTEHGVYVSFNDGNNWQPLQLDLPDTQIADLVLTEKDIVLGTHGRSIYVLDDISPIREYKPEIAKSASYLFKPYYAVRNVQNAVFQYYLNKEVTDLNVEILDPSGKVIQTFKGEKAKPQTNDSPDDEDGLGRKLPAPTLKAGLNKFEWDLHYPAATSFKGMILWGARTNGGPAAPPGNYQVRLTVAGQTFTQPFEIKLDPRLKNVTAADVQEQFKTAMMIRDQTSKANEAVIKIRDIKDKMAKAGIKDKKVLDDLSTIEENLYQVKNQSSQDPLNFPIKLNNRLAALGRSVETGDAKPTDASYKVYKELSADLEKQLTELNKVMQDPTIKKVTAPAI
jgi:hypothetical protein